MENVAIAVGPKFPTPVQTCFLFSRQILKVPFVSGGLTLLTTDEILTQFPNRNKFSLWQRPFFWRQRFPKVMYTHTTGVGDYNGLNIFDRREGSLCGSSSWTGKVFLSFYEEQTILRATILYDCLKKLIDM